VVCESHEGKIQIHHKKSNLVGCVKCLNEKKDLIQTDYTFLDTQMIHQDFNNLEMQFGIIVQKSLQTREKIQNMKNQPVLKI
jgi:hypothetical protein